MRRILITNDYGYRSEGLTALAARLKRIGDVTIVAPVQEASAIGHALTLRHPLRLERIAERVFAVDGTPTDCVNVAVALEAALLGIPALAVSLKAMRGEYDFAPAARAAAALADAVLRSPLPARTFLNVNVPHGEPKGLRVTVQAKRNHITSVGERH